jgi:uncharacterized protein (DUF2252 family)
MPNAKDIEESGKLSYEALERAYQISQKDAVSKEETIVLLRSKLDTLTFTLLNIREATYAIS